MTHIRPKPADYASFYEKYVALVPQGDLLATLELQASQWKSMLAGLSPAQSEVVGHVTDTERIFSYRALRIARGDKTPLSGFEQDDYIKEGNYAARTLADLSEEFATVRASTLSLLRSLSADAWTRRGNANQKEVTVCALGFITAGHVEHHRLILEQRYLPALPRA